MIHHDTAMVCGNEPYNKAEACYWTQLVGSRVAPCGELEGGFLGYIAASDTFNEDIAWRSRLETKLRHGSTLRVETKWLIKVSGSIRSVK
jgi:hypothetical protein